MLFHILCLCIVHIFYIQESNIILGTMKGTVRHLGLSVILVLVIVFFAVILLLIFAFGLDKKIVDGINFIIKIMEVT